MKKKLVYVFDYETWVMFVFEKKTNYITFGCFNKNRTHLRTFSWAYFVDVCKHLNDRLFIVK